jgi:cytochrome c oxidase cbb3-type subunit 1
MQPFYVWRGVGGLLMFLSHFVYAWNVWQMTYGSSAQPAPPVPARIAEDAA